MISLISESAHNTIVLVWIFSSVLSWATVGSMTSMGLMIHSESFRKGFRFVAFLIAAVCITTSAYVLPILLGLAIPLVSFADITGMAAFTAIIWSTIHTGGAIFSVFRYLKLNHQNAL